jgi:hypothetical protein
MQVVWRVGECGNQHSFEETCCVREEILTGVVMRHTRTSTSAKWEKEKGKNMNIGLINR